MGTKSIKIVKRMDKIDKELKDYKTFCCKDDFYVKSRANFRCKKCDKDVTIEVMFFIQAVSE